MGRYLVFCLLPVLHIFAPALAQEDIEAENSKYAAANAVGFVQYVDGDAELLEPGPREAALEFKRLIYLGDAFKVDDGDILKLATIEGCAAVFYGPIEVRAAVNKAGSWAVDSGVHRWVCPKGRKIRVNVKGSLLTLASSELFVNQDELLVIEGSARVNDKIVIADILHRYQNEKWVAVSSKYDIQELRDDWDDDYPVPSEVFRSEFQSERLDHYKLRLGAGVSFGYGFFDFTEDKEDLAFDRQLSGGRFWLSYDFDYLDLYLDIHTFELGYSDTPVSGDRDGEFLDFDLQADIFALGFRFNESKGLSYIASLGFGRGEVEATYNEENEFGGSNFQYERHEFFITQASFGLQKRFFDSRWYFVWSTLQLSAFYGTYTATYEGDSRDVPNLYGVMLFFGLGPALQF